ncbi:MAG: L-threonylcarbamoyladenylate synthase [Treponema sp.]|nr:L-threonylcarbamoyladenylate synthase [Treponema sp.]
MNYLPVTHRSLKQAAEIIRGGGIVAFPTETVYGLGADAFNAGAIAKVFEAKGRPRFDPLIIHIAAMETLEMVAAAAYNMRQKLSLLAKKFWPGPLSIVLPKNEKIPGIATAGLPTAAIRFPSHEAAQKLISLSGGAIAAPSANPFGALSPTKAEHVRDTLGNKVDMILDGGSAQIGLESTVLDITGGRVKILRHGGVSKEEIENLIGAVEDCTALENTDSKTAKAEEAYASPGQLKSHYAPKIPLSTFKTDDISSLPLEQNAAYLFFDDSSCDTWLEGKSRAQNPVFRVLSSSGQIREAAFRLFEILHELDSLRIKRIFAQFAPEQRLGMAINDRLRRASANT